MFPQSSKLISIDMRHKNINSAIMSYSNLQLTAYSLQIRILKVPFRVFDKLENEVLYLDFAFTSIKKTKFIDRFFNGFFL